MKTLIKNKNEILDIIECVKKGGVVAFPTDTVYGLGVVYDDEDALNRLKLSKGRPDNKPIPMMIASVEQLDSVAILNEEAYQLMEAFMPGAITLIVKKKTSVPDYVTNGFETIGCRMPDDDFILEMITHLNKPMLVTSANLSGEPTGTTFEEVRDKFDDRIDMIVKGECGSGQSSTIVELTSDHPKIIRVGEISEVEIMKVLGR